MSKRAPDTPVDLPVPFKKWLKKQKETEDLDDITKLIIGRCPPIDLIRWRQVCKLWSRTTPLIITDLCELSEDNLIVCDVLLSMVTNITRLDLTIQHCKQTVTDMGLIHLRNLRFLDLTACSMVTDKSMMTLTNLRELRMAYVSSITNKSMTALTNLTSLHMRDVSGVTEEGITHLTKLRILHLAHCTVPGSALTCLTNLTALNLHENFYVQDEAISNLTDLTYLDLTYNAKITDACVSRFTNLETLVLRYNRKITDEGVSNLRNLTSLNIHDSFVTAASVSNFLKLQELVATRTRQIDDDCLTKLTNLTDLKMDRAKSITDKGLKKMTQLRRLDLSYNSKVTDNAFRQLTNLRALHLNYNRNITNSALSILTNLTFLELNCSAATPSVIDALPNLAKFNRITTVIPIHQKEDEKIYNNNRKHNPNLKYNTSDSNNSNISLFDWLKSGRQIYLPIEEKHSSDSDVNSDCTTSISHSLEPSRPESPEPEFEMDQSRWGEWQTVGEDFLFGVPSTLPLLPTSMEERDATLARMYAAMDDGIFPADGTIPFFLDYERTLDGHYSVNKANTTTTTTTMNATFDDEKGPDDFPAGTFPHFLSLCNSEETEFGFSYLLYRQHVHKSFLKTDEVPFVEVKEEKDEAKPKKRTKAKKRKRPKATKKTKQKAPIKKRKKASEDNAEEQQKK